MIRSNLKEIQNNFKKKVLSLQSEMFEKSIVVSVEMKIAIIKSKIMRVETGQLLNSLKTFKENKGFRIVFGVIFDSKIADYSIKQLTIPLRHPLQNGPQVVINMGKKRKSQLESQGIKTKSNSLKDLYDLGYSVFDRPDQFGNIIKTKTYKLDFSQDIISSKEVKEEINNLIRKSMKKIFK